MGPPRHIHRCSGRSQRARENKRIVLEPRSRKSFNDSSILETSSFHLDDEDYEIDPKTAGLATFNLFITRARWKETREPPDDKSQLTNRAGLVKDVWEFVLSNVIADQTDLPCVYMFKGVNISNSADSSHYLRIEGICKSAKCENPTIAHVDADPGDADFLLTLRTTNTVDDKRHEVIRRPLRGIPRHQTGQQVF